MCIIITVYLQYVAMLKHFTVYVHADSTFHELCACIYIYIYLKLCVALSVEIFFLI